MALLLGTFTGVIVGVIIIIFIEVTDWYAVWDKLSGVRLRFGLVLLIFISLIFEIMDEAITYWIQPYIGTTLRLRYSIKLYPKAHWRLFWILHHFLWRMKDTIEWALAYDAQFYLDQIKSDRRA